MKKCVSLWAATFGVIAVVVMLAGCGGSGDNSAVPAGRAVETIRIYNWSEYLGEGILDGFEERTGIQVELSTFDSCSEMLSSLKADPSAYDIVIVDDSVIAGLMELKLIQPLDHSKIKGFDNLSPEFVNQAYDPGNKYSVPYLWGTTVLAYRSDKLDEEPDSWGVLWDTNLAGRIMMLDDSQEDFGVALQSLGYSINSHDPAELEAAGKLLIEQVPLVAAYTPAPSILEALISGECWAAPMYSGDVGNVVDEHEELAYVIPKEGGALWVDSLCIPRDARNASAAYALISYLLEPEIAADNANKLWYATPNAAARALTDEELLADEGIYPPQEVLARCEMYTKLDQVLSPVFNSTWAQLMEMSSAGSDEEQPIE
ncbi:MAG: spermidine/putrescine ABC transporter substrate-binding protein [Verrucomicrobia bacterium]|nr:spermidine/putrescine ABC transporter substrate-binding protein [Verrucomicrobiota bacterium]